MSWKLTKSKSVMAGTLSYILSLKEYCPLDHRYCSTLRNGGERISWYKCELPSSRGSYNCPALLLESPSYQQTATYF